MATVRTLVTRLAIEARQAFKDLKAYDLAFKAVAKSVAIAADSVEKNAARMVGALSAVQGAAAGVRTSAGARAGATAGTGSGGRRRGAGANADPIAAATRRANIAEAGKAGLDAGAKRINEATAALGTFAKASDRARAKVADLSAQVERNRREMAELRKKALETGDADGTLAARMRGLAAQTGIVMRELAGARKELRGFEGGLIQTIKQVTTAKITVEALGTALGNMLTGAVKGLAGGAAGILGESAQAAMGFEKRLVDIAKVAKDTDLTKDGLLSPRVIKGIKDASKDLGVMPEQVAELAAQITPVFSGKEDIVALTADVTKIGVAWDVSGQEAGKFFADVSRGMQMSAEETKKLFGGINQLGNELGVKAADIAEAFTRSAGVIKASGLSPETGAALNATLIAAGATAEVAATGVRTFVTRLEAGEAASAKQIEAFGKLGLSAKDVAHNMAQGGKVAEDQIQAVVKAIGGLDKENQISTLMQLFGSESLGSIGAAATAAENLGKAFGIASGEAAGFKSVLDEYNRVGNTTAARVDKLKANIGVLAIDLGEKLLPYIDKVVNFLTSPEGQEWGAAAVETAKNAVVGLAEAVGSLANFFGFLIEKIGGAGVAAAGFGVIIAGLAGPFGIALAAGVAMGAGIARAIDSVVNRARNAQAALDALHRKAEDLRRAERQHEFDDAHKEGEQQSLEIRQKKQAFDAAEAWYEREKKKAGGDKDGRLLKRRNAMESALLSGQYQPGTSFEERLAAFDGGAAGAPPSSALSPEAKMARFQDLVSRRKSLKPSEQKELRQLSKDLDMRIPTGGAGHKATKMDKQLAAMDPGVRALLTRGGEKDAGGDLKVHDDILSRGAFAAATKAGGGLGSAAGGGGSGGVGPGPNITSHNYFNNITITQDIDARGNAPAADNLRSAGQDVAKRASDVVLTGATKVLASRNAGGKVA